ncbi:hypothetical protein [Streptomyces xanthophaeus]
MGYWGWIVVAKGDSALVEHPAVTADGRVGVLHAYVRGDWREIWLDGGCGRPGAAAQAVARVTGAPAMVVVVADEDCAVLHAAAPAGAPWTGVFQESAALEYEAVPPGYVRARAVSGAMAWAAEAGLTADAAGAEAAFADGWYTDLLTALGFPEGAEAGP